MAQKTMVAKKQPVRPAKGASPKKAAVAKAPAKSAKPVKASAKKPVAPTQQIESAKAALKKETKASAASGANAPLTKAPIVKAALAPKAPASKIQPVKEISAKEVPVKKVASAAENAPKAKAEGKTARARKISIDINPNEASSALSAKWGTLFKKSEQIEAKPYDMKGVFEEKTAIVHKVLGWGYILANRNDRLEVLFKDGIKYLISNYKP